MTFGFSTALNYSQGSSPSCANQNRQGGLDVTKGSPTPIHEKTLEGAKTDRWGSRHTLVLPLPCLLSSALPSPGSGRREVGAGGTVGKSGKWCVPGSSHPPSQARHPQLPLRPGCSGWLFLLSWEKAAAKIFRNCWEALLWGHEEWTWQVWPDGQPGDGRETVSGR